MRKQGETESPVPTPGVRLNVLVPKAAVTGPGRGGPDQTGADRTRPGRTGPANAPPRFFPYHKERV